MAAVADATSAVVDVTMNRSAIVPEFAADVVAAAVVAILDCFFEYYILILLHHRRLHRRNYPTMNCTGVYFVVAAAASLVDWSCIHVGYYRSYCYFYHWIFLFRNNYNHIIFCNCSRKVDLLLYHNC